MIFNMIINLLFSDIGKDSELFMQVRTFISQVFYNTAAG